ncbi:hypothetical protein [Anaeroselena agilis]|uniref:DUF3899 domain-containing protein n=1 Tax=Anaeroselena agilis TaxID=3063788 RepID=A0ABU3NZQ9_9FIRM|nr:hypothetical protein [Selenomonadales bacterium 4137-cl]
MHEPQAEMVIAAFFAGLVIIYAFACAIGEENKARWFKKREQKGIFNRRGFLGDKWHFGHPRTWQGVAVMVAMYALIIVVGYIIIFVI